MSWKKNKVVLFLLLLIVGAACTSEPEPVVTAPPVIEEVEAKYASLDQLLSIDSLKAKQLAQQNLILIEVSQPEKYASGHIPGAINLTRSNLRSVKYPWKGMMLEAEALVQLMEGLKISESDTLILYDRKGGSDAARLWWVLNYYGHQGPIQLLDGGFLAWQKEGWDLEIEPHLHTQNSTATYTISGTISGPNTAATREEVLAAIGDTNYILIDTRTTDEFSGRRQKKGATRAGRIPGSVLWDWGNAVNLAEDGKLKSAKDLQYMLDFCGITRDKHIITYCHTGTRSSHTYLTLHKIMGYPHVKNYDGSWCEWSYADSLPTETDFEVPELVD